jgi:hypothetical protein
LHRGRYCKKLDKCLARDGKLSEALASLGNANGAELVRARMKATGEELKDLRSQGLG